MRSTCLPKGQEQLRPDLPDSVLRWNRCVRLLHAHPLLKEAQYAPWEDMRFIGDSKRVASLRNEMKRVTLLVWVIPSNANR